MRRLLEKLRPAATRGNALQGAGAVVLTVTAASVDGRLGGLVAGVALVVWGVLLEASA